MRLNLLTTTVPHDIHAGAVSVALERYGRTSARWYPSAYPLGDVLTFRVDGNRTSLALRTAHASLEVQNLKVDTFWYRRQGFPTLSRRIHRSDAAFSLKTCERLTDHAIATIASTSTLQVNEFENAIRVERSKLLQLEAAVQCGLRCPRTIISNCPDEIREFITRHPNAIFKSLMFNVWESKQGTATNFTSPVSLADLPSAEILRSCPGIFQENVEKDFEVRVTVMGSWLAAARLESQSISECQVDWRVQGPRVGVSPFQLPDNIRLRCLQLMRRLGLVFGCIDLVASPNGDFVFLEVNQMGQFLWLEERAPAIPLLDCFSQFLIAGTQDFSGPSASPRVSFPEIHSEAVALMVSDLDAYGFDLDQQTNTIAE